jgi:hypothetical protein
MRFFTVLIFCLTTWATAGAQSWISDLLTGRITDGPAEGSANDPDSVTLEEDRLLAMYAVNNATVTDVVSWDVDNGQQNDLQSFSNITISFETGPNLRVYNASAYCVPKGGLCSGTPVGDGKVFVALPRTATKRTIDVVISSVAVTEETQFDCFVELDQPVLSKRLCFPVSVPGAQGPCTGPQQAPGTSWVFSCGSASCTETCEGLGLECNADGMRAVDTEGKGLFVLGLVNQGATAVFSADYPDAPVVDYYSPFRSEFYWNGATSTNFGPSLCPEPGLYPVSQRICCCGSLAECPTG